MASIVGKVIGQFHMQGEKARADAAKNYRRDQRDPQFPFGKEVTLAVVRGYIGNEVELLGGWWTRAYKQGGAGYNGIILGPKFNPDGSVNESIIGIGTGNEILDFEFDPEAPLDADGHAMLMLDECPNDFAEYAGWRSK